jgi:hypothetical protein
MCVEQRGITLCLTLVVLLFPHRGAVDANVEALPTTGNHTLVVSGFHPSRWSMRASRAKVCCHTAIVYTITTHRSC